MKAMAKPAVRPGSHDVSSTPARPAPPSRRRSSLLHGLEVFAVTGLLTSSAFLPGGMLTAHMAGHIVLMSVAAPLCAWLLERRFGMPGPWASTGSALLLATATQLLVFFVWHSPPAMALSMHSLPARVLMLALLFMSAVWFWTCIIAAIRQEKVIAVAALLLTGKLVCLVAALLVFAPRLLYQQLGTQHGGLLADQQLAGLIMLSACPLTYIGASVLLVACWFSGLSSSPVEARP